MNTPRIFELFNKESMNVDNYFYDNVFNRSKKLLLLTTPNMLVGTRFTVKSAEPLPASGIAGLDAAKPLLDKNLPVPVVINAAGDYFIPGDCVYPIHPLPSHAHSFGVITDTKETHREYQKAYTFYIFVITGDTYYGQHIQVTTPGRNFFNPELDRRGFTEYPLECFCKVLLEYIKRTDVSVHVQFPWLFTFYMVDPEYFIGKYADAKPAFLYPAFCEIKDLDRHIGVPADEYDYSQKTSA